MCVRKNHLEVNTEAGLTYGCWARKVWHEGSLGKSILGLCKEK